MISLLLLLPYAADSGVTIGTGTGTYLTINGAFASVIVYLYRRDAKRSDDVIARAQAEETAARESEKQVRNDLASLNEAFMGKPLDVLTQATVALERASESSRVNADLAKQLLSEVQRLEK